MYSAKQGTAILPSSTKTYPEALPQAVIAKETPKPAVPKPVVNENSAVPQFVEVRKQEPLPPNVLAKEMPKPAQLPKPSMQRPELVKESMTKTQPPPDTPVGFASTRRKANKVATEDQAMGFARSRR